ncbi:MAG: DUF2914 domain-containing protein [Myxococcales bacterium]|nr:DUF2914 domain-containing protein [Myxococcales bacterium]
MTNRTAIATVLAAIIALPSTFAIAAPSAPTKRAPSASSDASVSLGRFVFANELSGRKPVAPADRFDTDGKRVYGYLEVRNKGERQKLTMTWTRGARSHTFNLTVGKSPRWRTWSYLKAVKGNRGSWKVTVKDESGSVLGEKQITIGGAINTAKKSKKSAKRSEPVIGC